MSLSKPYLHNFFHDYTNSFTVGMLCYIFDSVERATDADKIFVGR
jgi:hypothetical protein